MTAFQSSDSEAIFAFKMRLGDLLTQADLSIAQAAAKLNISSERLYKYLNAGIPNSLPAYLLPLWTRMIGPELLRALAFDVSYAVEELPRVLPDWQNSIELAAKVTHDCGEILSIMAKSDEDQITARDLRHMRQLVQHAIAALLGMQMVAEAQAKVVPRPH